jgi:hypothetical protein
MRDLSPEQAALLKARLRVGRQTGAMEKHVKEDAY